MSLGSYFPEECKDDFFKRNFKVGQILYLYINFNPTPKNKYLLLVCPQRDPLFFIINSKIHDFIKARPLLLEAQIALDPKRHDFLSHKSFIDCSEVFDGLSLDEVKRQIADDANRVRGMVATDILQKVKTAVHRAKKITKHHKDRILGNLSSF